MKINEQQSSRSYSAYVTSSMFKVEKFSKIVKWEGNLRLRYVVG
jgi:hypothetical protein